MLKNRVTTDLSDAELKKLNEAVKMDNRTIASALRKGISLYIKEVINETRS